MSRVEERDEGEGGLGGAHTVEGEGEEDRGPEGGGGGWGCDGGFGSALWAGALVLGRLMVCVSGGGVRQDWQVVLGKSYKFDCLAAV